MTIIIFLNIRFLIKNKYIFIKKIYLNKFN